MPSEKDGSQAAAAKEDDKSPSAAAKKVEHRVEQTAARIEARIEARTNSKVSRTESLQLFGCSCLVQVCTACPAPG